MSVATMISILLEMCVCCHYECAIPEEIMEVCVCCHYECAIPEIILEVEDVDYNVTQHMGCNHTCLKPPMLHSCDSKVLEVDIILG